MARKKTRGSRFRHGLHVYLSLLCFVAALLLIVLWVYLSRYQVELNRQNEEQARLEAVAAYDLAVSRAPQLAFEDFLRESDGVYWAQQWFATHPESYDDEGRVQQYFDELLDSETLRAYKDGSYAEGKPVYLLKNGMTAIARIALSGAGMDWTVSGVDLLLEGGESAELSVPNGFRVYCNGTLLPAGADAGTKLYDMASYESLLINPVAWQSYRVEGQLFEPVMTAEPPEGSEVVKLEDGSVFYTLNEEESASYQQRAEVFVHDLLRYYMMGNINTNGNMQKARSHVEPGSPAYIMITDTYAGVIWDTSYGNTNYQIEPGPACRLADNCLLVDVSYHAEGWAGGHTNVADGVYRVYFLDHGNGYQIYVLTYR